MTTIYWQINSSLVAFIILSIFFTASILLDSSLVAFILTVFVIASILFYFHTVGPPGVARSRYQMQTIQHGVTAFVFNRVAIGEGKTALYSGHVSHFSPFCFVQKARAGNIASVY